MHINLTWNYRVCVRVVFLCLLCACLPGLTKNKDGVHFFTLNFECHNTRAAKPAPRMGCISENRNIKNLKTRIYLQWRSGLPAHLRTRLKEAPGSFRATGGDVMLSASHPAATALLHQSTLLWHHSSFCNDLQKSYGTLAATVPLYNISTLCNT